MLAGPSSRTVTAVLHHSVNMPQLHRNDLELLTAGKAGRGKCVTGPAAASQQPLI